MAKQPRHGGPVIEYTQQQLTELVGDNVKVVVAFDGKSYAVSAWLGDADSIGGPRRLGIATGSRQTAALAQLVVDVGEELAVAEADDA